METNRRALITCVAAFSCLIGAHLIPAAPAEKTRQEKEPQAVVDEEDRIPAAEKKGEVKGALALTFRESSPDRRAAEMVAYFTRRYERLSGASFSPIAQAIVKTTGAPDEYAIHLADYYANGLWISGQRWELDPDVDIAHISAIPAESQVVGIAKGELLQPRIAGIFPAYERLSGGSKRLVLDRVSRWGFAH